MSTELRQIVELLRSIDKRLARLEDMTGRRYDRPIIPQPQPIRRDAGFTKSTGQR